MRGEPCLEPPVDRLGQELELNAPRGLPVDGIGQAGLPHLLEHTPYSLTQLLPKTEIGTDAGDARVPREANGLERVTEVNEARKPPWARDLDPVIEDLDPDVVSSHAVGTMNRGVDDSLEPSIARHKRNILEGPALTERPPSRLKPLDLLPGLP